ncbi:flagellar basal body rod protein FlgC [Pelagovum sp. HNIBRBA483]|uniref:flagellar basal body rod protein FlgC n=1 Tax=Pelagovum sp. HNIBRBA483 TaxID=3233341 RepID=UPI0034A4DD74
MADLSTALSIASSGMAAQSRRLRHVSENIANADTPGYHRKLIQFSSDAEDGVAVGRIRLDDRPLPDIFDPGHPLANADGYYQGSNVDLLTEIADAREAQRSYEANLKMFDQVRQMSSALMDLLKK